MKRICTKPDKYHKLGHEYTIRKHDMPNWYYVKETGKYMHKSQFRKETHPYALAAIENKRLKESL